MQCEPGTSPQDEGLGRSHAEEKPSVRREAPERHGTLDRGGCPIDALLYLPFGQNQGGPVTTACYRLDFEPGRDRAGTEGVSGYLFNCLLDACPGLCLRGETRFPCAVDLASDYAIARQPRSAGGRHDVTVGMFRCQFTHPDDLLSVFQRNLLSGCGQREFVRVVLWRLGASGKREFQLLRRGGTFARRIRTSATSWENPPS